MNQHDQELLDKQLRGVSHSPRWDASMIGMAFVVVFLVGIAIGDIRSTNETKQMQTASHNMTTAFSLLDGVPPTIMR
jgi:hypothetical protein